MLAFGLVASLGLGGCAPQTETNGGETDAGQPQKGGTMSFYIGEPSYIDPYNAQESEGMQVTQVLFDSLTDFDDQDPTKLVPAAAESWQPNEDATVWTFKLNPEGKFSDGTPVTANDFVYAWNRVVNPKTKNSAGEEQASDVSYHLGIVKGYDEVIEGKATEMSGIRAVDDLTFEVTLARPFADFEYVVAHPALSPVSQKAVEEGTQADGQAVAFGEMPVGNGPFKMAEPWKHNQYIKVVRNENYYGDEPYLDGVDFRIFKDPETAYTEFEAGNLDFTQIGEGKIKDAESKYGTSDDGYTVNPGKQVLLGAENSIYFLAIQNQTELLKNADLRKAISLAINRQAICDTIFEGTREPADNILPPGIAGYSEGAWQYSKYDIEAAKKALADAGYPEGQGLPTFKLSFNSGGGHEKIMELVQADLAAIGIKTEFQSADAPAYWPQLQEGKFEIARMGWIADYPIAYNFLYSLLDQRSGDNYSQYKNQAVSDGIDEAVQMTDAGERQAKFEEINKMIGDDAAVAPIMFYKHHHVGSDRINDFTFTPMYFGNFSKVWISDAAAAE